VSGLAWSGFYQGIRGVENLMNLMNVDVVFDVG
jgi:hypothetical protein